MADWCHTMGWQHEISELKRPCSIWDSARLRKFLERSQTDGLQQSLSSTSPTYYLEDSLVPRHFHRMIKWSEVPADVCMSVGLSFRTCIKHWALTIQEKMQPRIKNWAASTPFCFISWGFGCKWPHQPLHIAVVLNHTEGFERDTAAYGLYPPLLKSPESPPKSTTALPPASLVGLTVVISRAPLATWFNGQLSKWQLWILSRAGSQRALATAATHP